MVERKPIQIEQKHRRLSDAVFNSLRQAILDGQLVPGQWLRQEALAQEMGVSQITVREALTRLAGEGLCVYVPYKGVRVFEPTTEDLETIYTMRNLLEGLATELAASRITPEEIAQMKALLPETIVNADPESVNRARVANRKFHEIAIHASGRRHLIQILNQIWDWFDPMRIYAYSLETDEEQGIEIRERLGASDRATHTRLIELLEAGDGEGARRLVSEYVQEAWNNQLSEMTAPVNQP
jgi:DNA-binding GntR family transcriptional regulator